jgi:hypothetical protein
VCSVHGLLFCVSSVSGWELRRHALDRRQGFSAENKLAVARDTLAGHE